MPMALASSSTVWRLASNRDAARPKVKASMKATRPKMAATIAPTGAFFSSTVPRMSPTARSIAGLQDNPADRQLD